MEGLKTYFIKHMKVLGALDNLDGIINHTYNPSFVLNVLFHSSPVELWYDNIYYASLSLRKLVHYLIDLINLKKLEWEIDTSL